MRLFAARGYQAVSVAEIQVAAGMTPGSGALYKHFPTKQALLEAGIDRFIAEGRHATLELPDPSGGELEELLRQVGDLVLKALAHDQDSLRVAWRDLPAFPALSSRFVDERLHAGFAQLAHWLSDLSHKGVVHVDDAQATAGVLLSALTFFRLTEALLGVRPGWLSDSRFLDAWVDVAVGALRHDGRDLRQRRR
jgi:AcrR family transcriptional regulator